MTKAVPRKLGLNPGMRALIIGPPSGYLKLLKPLPEVLTPSSKTGAASAFVQVFVTRLFDTSKFEKSRGICGSERPKDQIKKVQRV